MKKTYLLITFVVLFSGIHLCDTVKPVGQMIREGSRIVMDVGVAATGAYAAYKSRDRRDSISSNPSNFNKNITWTTSKKPRISRSITKTGGSLIRRK